MKRVLVIDDEAMIRSLLRTILSVAGREVFEAGDGAEALRLLEGQPVELVLCDLRMPVMDGLETGPRRWPTERGFRPPGVARTAGGKKQESKAASDPPASRGLPLLWPTRRQVISACRLVDRRSSARR
jgi:CheY-like chemotaxis protein